MQTGNSQLFDVSVVQSGTVRSTYGWSAVECFVCSPSKARVQRVDLHFDVVIVGKYSPTALALAPSRPISHEHAGGCKASDPTKFPTGFNVFRPIHHTSSAARLISRSS